MLSSSMSTSELRYDYVYPVHRSGNFGNEKNLEVACNI